MAGIKTKRFIFETNGSGAAFFDYDNDGLPDIFIILGEGAPSRLYHNEGKGGFTDLFLTYWGQYHLYRNLGSRSRRRPEPGAAFADCDNDGSNEIVWSITRMRCRSALGARVRVTAGGRTQADEVRSGGSYLSHNDLQLRFGLGTAAKVDRIENRLASGARQTLRDVAADRVAEIVEKP